MSARVPPKAARWPAAIRSTAARRRFGGKPVRRRGGGLVFDTLFFKRALPQGTRWGATVVEWAVLIKPPGANAAIGKD